MKLGFLFSGQGSQFKEMGQDLYQTEPIYKQTVDEASTVLGIDLTNADVFDDPDNVQVAIVTMSTGINRILATEIGQPVGATGLSLGEYSALVAAGALDLETALPLVADRTRYMAEAGAQNPGKMAAVMKAAPEVLEQAIDEGSKHGKVYPANYNTASQVVIGGDADGVAAASEYLKSNGVKRVVPLNVAVASHTPLMQLASEKLNDRLKTVTFSEPNYPVISNTTADRFEASDIPSTLTKQLVSPTHFDQCAEKLASLSVDTFVEIGPGATLTKLVKKSIKGVETYHVDSVETLAELREKLG
ncbi:ACP S-malonyltransferase [Lentilactobacillus sp. Marseille-Q4993]|uniref:ACP S-malonyltransferase n=1 Tax=Lentilactobacillus sp. Marseille-Q4993 TaxID=3039492 RepID=UPI0024BCC3BC|nr:ACP S-malonyltransferase [Lentilactobacillus sp. Marseille-Q4993]